MSSSEIISSSAIDRDNPWPGLASFTEDARGFFFGREKETDELSRLVRRQTLTVLFGQSGLGKSSLLQAGLFPLLRDADFLPLYLRLDHGLVTQVGRGVPAEPRLTEAGSPYHQSVVAPTLADQVKAALVAAFKAVGADAPAPRADESLWEYFHRKDVDIWSAKNRLLTPVLAFDQFEEIFTLGRASDAARERSRAFLDELACLVENRPPAAVQTKLDSGELDPARFNFTKPSCQVILSLREDFLPDLEGLKQAMPALVHNRLRLKKLSGTQALEIVTRPAPHLLADGVAEKIVEFVAGARGGSAERLAELDVEPPLLSVICRELNDRRRSLGQTQITADLVSGNRREILTNFYERSVADLPAEMRAFIEDRLLTKSGFRDNLALESALEISGVTRPLLDTLVARRLLRIEERLGVQRVELTHDVLAEVIRASRDARQQRLAVEEARAHEQRALAAVTARTRKLRWLIAGLATLVVALCLGGLYGLHARRLALQSASRTDAAFASRLLEEGNTGDGLAYFVRAARKDPQNAALAPRLLSSLASRGFLLPAGAALELPSPSRPGLHYARDGRRLWTLGEDSVVRVVDVAARRITQEFRFDQPVRGVTFPEDNDAVFAVRFQDFSLRMFDSSTGQPLTPPMRADEAVAPGNTLSPDGRWLAVIGQTKVFIWDATTGERRATIGRNDPGVVAGRLIGRMIFSPDGRHLLVSFQSGFISQWTSADGKPAGDEIRIGGVVAGQYAGVTYSPDGRLFAVAGLAGGVQLFDTATQTKVGPVMPHGLAGRAIFSRDGQRLLVLGIEGASFTARLWRVPTGEPLGAAWPVVGILLGAADGDSPWSDDGRVLLALDRNGAARVWDVATGKLLAEPAPAFGKKSHATLSPDGMTFVVAAGTTLNFFRAGGSAAQPLALRRVAPFLGAPFLAGTPARLLRTEAERAQVLEVAAGREIEGGFAFPRSIVSLTTAGSEVRTDGRVMVVATGDARHELTADSHFEAWRIEGGKVTAVRLQDAPLGQRPAANYVVFSATQERVALAANTPPQALRVWDLTTGQPITPPLLLDARLLYVNARPASFSPDATKLAAGDANGVVRVWEIPSGRVLFDLDMGRANCRVVTFSPDGERIVVGTVGPAIRMWDAQTGKPLSELLSLDAGINEIVFSEDGRRVAVANGGDGARLFDGRTLEPMGEPIGGGEATRSVRFSHDGRRIVTGANAGGARIWDAATLEALSETLVHPGTRVVTAEFSPDDRYLRTETANTLFYLWPVPPAGDAPVPEWLRDLATICAGRRLSDEGRMEPATDVAERIAAVRRTLAELPDDAPYVEWGRWLIADPATRSIAPGFTITPAEAETLAKEMAGMATP
ncbi:MAG: hypothetical protein ABIZ49_02190 [Opitutaceae bacterium]